MDPLLTAAAFSTISKTWKAGRPVDEQAFYEVHGRPIVRRAIPAVPAIAATVAVVLLVGFVGGA